jgi:biotin transporter BioY
MNPAIVGQAFGFVLMFAIIPGLIAGLFRRKREPSTNAIRWTWAVVLALAASTLVNGDGTSVIAIAIALAVLGALTAMRYSAWRKRAR